MAMMRDSIASRVKIHRRYVRSVNLERDVDDPDALVGYIVTPSVRDAAVRILTGLSAQSHQRAFRIVGPFGVGKSAFALFLAQLLRERGNGPATRLLSEAAGKHPTVTAWRPVILTGRRVSFARELLRVVQRVCADRHHGKFLRLRKRVLGMLNRTTPLDADQVIHLVGDVADELRSQSGEGLFLLIDEMGHFVEYAASDVRAEDPAIFQLLAERSGGRAGVSLAVAGFLHHRFVDYVAGMGQWIEAEWSRFSERYEELSFGGSTEQSLFMIASAFRPVQKHTDAVLRRATELYSQAMDRNLFAMPPEEVIGIASDLYPLHPATVAALGSATRRFGQNERSLFGFLQSLEPASFTRFAHRTQYDAAHWYRAPMVFEHLAATLSEHPRGPRARRWSLAFDTLAGAAGLPPSHQDVLKTVALVAVLEPVPGIVSDCSTIAWCLEKSEEDVRSILENLSNRNFIYRRPHRQDYSLWSNSSVDLTGWLDDARTTIRPTERLDGLATILDSTRSIVAHRHYHKTGTLRTFDVTLWTGKRISPRTTDGLIHVVPVYLGEDRGKALLKASALVSDDPLTLLCARRVAPSDVKWAYELALWKWISTNCAELRLDDLARAEVSERIASANQALTSATALLSSTSAIPDEKWWYAGKEVTIPKRGLSALLSNICDRVYSSSPTLKNELINHERLSPAVASARIRLLGRMLTKADHKHLGLTGAPPERTIYLSLFEASGIHRQSKYGGGYCFGRPGPEDPNHWRPVWDHIARTLDCDEPIRFSDLMASLAAPPLGLRSGPALLIIAAYFVASRKTIAMMERNSFQPGITVAHFMRLSKSPNNFALKTLLESDARKGLIHALATRLAVIPTCEPVITEISKSLYEWYNSLSRHSLKTKVLSPTATAVREVLRRATEPSQLFFTQLPMACGSLSADGIIDIDLFVGSLDGALLEIDEATRLLRSRAVTVVQQVFGVPDLPTLRAQLRADYEARRSQLNDYRLRVFIERAVNENTTPDRWLDGIAGHLTGQRPDNWSDEMLGKFEIEIRATAGNLTRWLALTKKEDTPSEDLRSIHVVAIDGSERVIIVRRNRPNPYLAQRLSAVRAALGTEPQALEVLSHLLAEYADISPECIRPHGGSRV